VPAAGGPGTTFLHESWRPRIVMSAFPLLVIAILIAGSNGTTRVIGLAVCAVVLLDELLRLLRPVAALSPEMIVVRGLRSHEVAWHRIAEITTTKRLGSHRIVLVVDDGTRVVLEGPTANFLARGNFDKAMETITRHWTERRHASRPAPTTDA
jgi:hypothetical protein